MQTNERETSTESWHLSRGTVHFIIFWRRNVPTDALFVSCFFVVVVFNLFCLFFMFVLGGNRSFSLFWCLAGKQLDFAGRNKRPFLLFLYLAGKRFLWSSKWRWVHFNVFFFFLRHYSCYMLVLEWYGCNGKYFWLYVTGVRVGVPAHYARGNTYFFPSFFPFS